MAVRRERLMWAGAVGVVAVVSFTSFLLTRGLTDEDAAKAEPQLEPRPTEQLPGYDETPIPGATPDKSDPNWWVPYWNEDRDRPNFVGEIAGVQIGTPPGNDVDGVCASRPVTLLYGDVAAEKWKASPVSVNLKAIPDWATLNMPQEFTVCADGSLNSSQTVLRVDDPTGKCERGCGAITIFRTAGAVRSPATATVPLWSEGIVAGHPAAIARPPAANIGNSWVAIRDEETGVLTTLWGQGLYVETLLEIAEAVMK